MSVCGLKDKVVLITGSTSGIGKGTALYFAGLGSNLVLTGRRAENLDSTKAECVEKGLKPDQVLLIPGDINDGEHRKNLIKQTVQKFGKLDVLVNNAGVPVQKPNLEQTLEDFDFVFNVNVRAVVDLSQIAIPHLIESKGSIVNVSSVGSTISLGAGAYYNMTKAAIDSFTTCFALSLAPKGVRVNSVNPGPVLTEIGQKGEYSKDTEKMWEAVAGIQPCGRCSQPEEIGRAIAFLAAPESGFITGVCLVLDGGLKLTNAMAGLFSGMFAGGQ